MKRELLSRREATGECFLQLTGKKEGGCWLPSLAARLSYSHIQRTIHTTVMGFPTDLCWTSELNINGRMTGKKEKGILESRELRFSKYLKLNFISSFKNYFSCIGYLDEYWSSYR